MIWSNSDLVIFLFFFVELFAVVVVAGEVKNICSQSQGVVLVFLRFENFLIGCGRKDLWGVMGIFGVVGECVLV